MLLTPSSGPRTRSRDRPTDELVDLISRATISRRSTIAALMVMPSPNCASKADPFIGSHLFHVSLQTLFHVDPLSSAGHRQKMQRRFRVFEPMPCWRDSTYPPRNCTIAYALHIWLENYTRQVYARQSVPLHHLILSARYTTMDLRKCPELLIYRAWRTDRLYVVDRVPTHFASRAWKYGRQEANHDRRPDHYGV